MNCFDLFWKTMELCDWHYEGDDDRVLEPVISYLSRKNDDIIFKFNDMMSELLYNLDIKYLLDQCRKADPYMCDDTFLYSRCVALINGPDYYESVMAGNQAEVWEMEFESLLYVPQKAWAARHHLPEEEYPHVPPLSYETGSNWKI